MPISPLFFDIPLSRPPQIVQAAAVSPRPAKIEHYRLEKVYYRIERLWCLNLFLGEGELRINDSIVPIHTGYAGITRPNVDLEYRYSEPATLSWVHFTPDESADTAPISAMTDLSEQFESFRKQVQTIATQFILNRSYATAILWSSLWQLTRMNDGKESALQDHPAVVKAIELINLRLRDELTAAGIARDVGISQNHLNRLFFLKFKTAVADYIRMRRVRRAEHLLTFSDIPIKNVAMETGFKNVQHFCHVIRRVLHQSPGAIRSKLRK